MNRCIWTARFPVRYVPRERGDEPNHLWTHGEGYYRKRNWLRGTELVANQISILGSGPFGEKLLRKVLPALTEDLVNYLKAVP